MAYLSMGEAHRRITDYLNRFFDAVSTQDRASLKHLLSLSPPTAPPSSPSPTPSKSSRTVRSQFGESLVHLFRALQSYGIRNFIDSYQCFYSGVSELGYGLALPTLYVVAYKIRVLAERVDKELSLNGKSPEKLKEAGSFLMEVFGVLASMWYENTPAGPYICIDGERKKKALNTACSAVI